MTAAVPVIENMSAARPSPTVGPTHADLAAAARSVIAPFVAGEQRHGPDIEHGFADLARLVDDFERKHVVGRLAPYLVDEALVAIKRVRDVGNLERSRAAEEVRQAEAGIAALSTVPHAEFADVLIDQEIRAAVRGMTTKERTALLGEMQQGGQVRAMLAASRAPMPSDFDRDAAALYGQFAEPSKRRNLMIRSEVYAAKRDAARTLIEAADATKRVVAWFIELDAALQAEEANASAKVHAATITRPAGVPPPASTNPAPQWSRPSVQIEGSAITRID